MPQRVVRVDAECVAVGDEGAAFDLGDHRLVWVERRGLFHAHGKPAADEAVIPFLEEAARMKSSRNLIRNAAEWALEQLQGRS